MQKELKLFLPIFLCTFFLVLILWFVFTKINDAKYPYYDSKDVKVTLDEYNLLKSGMSEDEVWNIIGGKCTNTGTTDMGIGSETVSYGCNGYGSTGANVILIFHDGELSSLSQTGLK